MKMFTVVAGALIKKSSLSLSMSPPSASSTPPSLPRKQQNHPLPTRKRGLNDISNIVPRSIAKRGKRGSAKQRSPLEEEAVRGLVDISKSLAASSFLELDEILGIKDL